MSPHFSSEKRAPEEVQADLHNDTGSCDLLLSHRVPSASLYLEEMMAQCPTSTSPLPQHITGYPQADTRRSSVATLVDFGDWICVQSHRRPPSLLPPAPQLVRLPSSDTKVECRLSSPVTPPRAYSSTGRSPKREPLSNLSAYLQEISFSAESPSPPATRPITPVPSPTTSNYCRSSFGAAEVSPGTTISSARTQLLSSPLRKNMTTTNGVPFEVAVTRPFIHNVGSPFPSPTFHQADHIGWSTLPVGPPTNLSYRPFRPMPSSEVNVAAIEPPRPTPDSHEVSYIEWDDHDNNWGDSAIARIKKNFTNMRAAERHITQANTRSKIQAAKSVEEASAPSMGYVPPNTSSIFHGATDSTSVQGDAYKSAPVKLRKNPSTECNALPARSLSNDSPSDPPSTGKRKRTNTVTSQRSQEVHKKKPKSSRMVKLVRRLLGVK